jgi:GT2 family glycosyltransferase
LNSISQNPVVSIVLITYKDKNYLEQCLKNITINVKNLKFEIILVDNSSPDDISGIINKYSELIHYIRLPINLGFGRANNIGIKYAKGQYILLLNTDTLLSENVIIEMLSVIKSDSKIGLVSAMVLPFSYQNKKFVEDDKIRYINVPTTTGCCMLFRKNQFVLGPFGVFDPYFFFYAEDLDLCFRVWLEGKRVVVLTNSYIYHASTGIKFKESQHSDIKYRYGFHYFLYYTLKWRSSLYSIFLIFVTLFNAIKTYLIERNKLESTGMIKGVFDCFHHIKYILAIRSDLRNKYHNIEEICIKLKKMQKSKGIDKKGRIFRIYSDELYQSEYFQEKYKHILPKVIHK